MKNCIELKKSYNKDVRYFMKSNFGIEFFGLDSYFMDDKGNQAIHTFLDTAASSLCMVKPFRYREEMLSLYGNIHSQITRPSLYCTDEFENAKFNILSFLGLEGGDHLCIFVGSGSTGAINLFARLLSDDSSGTVVISEMEHHSNDLPHRMYSQNIKHVSSKIDESGELAGVDVDQFCEAVSEPNVKYAAITGCSNVTGIRNSVHEIAAFCNIKHIPILLDASQSLTHCLDVMYKNSKNKCFDAIAFSGHKSYAPGTPGVLIIRKSLFESRPFSDLGGGVVKDVSKYSFEMRESAVDRTQAGTPDFLGGVQIAQALSELAAVGCSRVQAHEDYLTRYLIEKLKSLGSTVTVYGSEASRSGIVSFNIENFHHEQLTRILSEKYCISLRNACFCAHPYVRSLLRNQIVRHQSKPTEQEIEFPGMVRASLGVYSTTEDIDRLINALDEITTVKRTSNLKKLYVNH